MFFTVIEGDIVLIDSSGNEVGVILDGSTYRLQTEAKVDFPSVQPVSDNDDSLTVDAISWPLPDDAATESTLASIRDQYGIKKIAEQLPAGTNEIGKVAQGIRSTGDNAWPQVLYDSSGNQIGVVFNDTYRLQVESSISPDEKSPLTGDLNVYDRHTSQMLENICHLLRVIATQLVIITGEETRETFNDY
jgi:hypothetical protein